MKYTVNDDNGNVLGYIDIDDISEIPEASRDEMISKIRASTKEYLLAKIAHDEEMKKAELEHEENCRQIELEHEENCRQNALDYEELKKELTARVKGIVDSFLSLKEELKDNK